MSLSLSLITIHGVREDLALSLLLTECRTVAAAAAFPPLPDFLRTEVSTLILEGFRWFCPSLSTRYVNLRWALQSFETRPFFRLASWRLITLPSTSLLLISCPTNPQANIMARPSFILS